MKLLYILQENKNYIKVAYFKHQICWFWWWSAIEISDFDERALLDLDRPAQLSASTWEEIENETNRSSNEMKFEKKQKLINNLRDLQLELASP